MNSRMRKCANFMMLVPAFALVVVGNVEAFAQGAGDRQPCVDPQSSGIHRFRKEWESFEITLRDNTPDSDDCQVISLELRWANGRRYGSNFNVTFVDANNQPIYSRQLSGFQTGHVEFPLTATSNVEAKPWLGTPWMIAVPASITVQAVRPFVAPSNIWYRVVRAPGNSKVKASPGQPRKEEKGRPANEIVRIQTAVRLIGSTRISLVLIELKASQPFPVREAALQLQIGKKVFLHELSGDHTGRTLTLSLTPAMFAELEDGATVVAFFDKPEGGDVWSFGKLDKKTLEQ